MRVTAIILFGWLALSIAFGCFWVLAALTLKAARRRWPQLVVDPPRHGPPSAQQHAGKK